MQPGAHLAQYEILAAIGRGGMGEVWKARDTNLGREVAIKTLPAEFTRNTDYVARFRREARAASALNHPNICTIYDLGEQNGRPFIVMELLTGETLKEKLARGPLPVSEALDVGLQLADGLDAAHAAGIIHRDIKPANIFVTDRGTAKLLDFGLARVQAESSPAAPTLDFGTGAGAVLGTVSYMSPEQARGEALDARTDLFSLGVVFYEMTTGRPAFSGSTSAVIFDRLLNRVPDPPTRLNPKIPAELAALIDGLLAKDRNQRASSAREIKTTMHRIRGDSGLRSIARREDDRKSIIVLPFQNMSADADNEYFSDGLTDEIITDLSQVGSLRVISRSSSMQIRSSGKDLKAVAEQLNVRYVLDGSVRRAGNAVRVTAQLIDPDTDEHLWADKYSGKLEDVFEIQEQISRRIVDALKVRLSPEEDEKLAERPIDNVEALECYHRAAHEIYKFTEDGLERALQLIDTALGIVGDNALLLATKGVVYFQYVNAAIKPDDGYIDKAADCARSVLALDPNSAAGHVLAGMVNQNRGRPADADRSYKTALAIDPTNMYALAEACRIYLCVGRVSQSRAVEAQWANIDPLSPLRRAQRIFQEFLSGDDEVAQDAARRLLRHDPDFPVARLPFVLSLIRTGRRDEARDEIQAATAPAATLLGSLLHFLMLALDDKPDEAAVCVSPELLERARAVEWWSWHTAECYAVINDRERAIDWLENAFQRGFWNYPYLAKHSTTLFRRLDDHPRFQDLLGRVKTAWAQFDA